MERVRNRSSYQSNFGPGKFIEILNSAQKLKRVNRRRAFAYLKV